MARMTLGTNRKFRHLVQSLGNRALARGILELLWEPCYETGDPYVGTADDLEAVVGWTGQRGALTKALLEAGAPKGAGFIEAYEGDVRDAKQPHYQIHDFFHHCPKYVYQRHTREREKTLSKVCTVCGRPYYSVTNDSLYCSSPCRQLAWRRRSASATPARDVTQDVTRYVTERVTEGVTLPAAADALQPRDANVTCNSYSYVTLRSKSPDSIDDVTRYAERYTTPQPVRTGTSTDSDEIVPVGVLVPAASSAPTSAEPSLPKPSKPKPVESPILLTFPVVGKGGPSWQLREAAVEHWRVLYPTLDIVSEARKALAWVEADLTRRKTAGGMDRFLVSWFNRAVDRRHIGPTIITGSPRTAGNKEALQRFLDRRGIK